MKSFVSDNNNRDWAIGRILNSNTNTLKVKIDLGYRRRQSCSFCGCLPSSNCADLPIPPKAPYFMHNQFMVLHYMRTNYSNQFLTSFLSCEYHLTDTGSSQASKSINAVPINLLINVLMYFKKAHFKVLFAQAAQGYNCLNIIFIY